MIPKRRGIIRNIGFFNMTYRPPPHIEACREEFRAKVHIPPNLQLVDQIAECQLWTGAISKGQGIIYAGRRYIPIQTFAFELFFDNVPTYDTGNYRTGHVHMVARCVAAQTKNCVHPDHLGLVEARTSKRWFPITTLEDRQAIRESYDHEQGAPTFLEAKWSLPFARIARIVTFREGPDDPKTACG